MPVGEQLAAERRKQGRTLLEVESSTNIMRRLLQQLEEGRYGELPSPAYVRGYIQNYAHFLGMDAEPLLREFETDVKTAALRLPRLDELPERTVIARRDQVHHIAPKAWFMLVIALAAIALAAWAFTAFFSAGDEPLPILPETTSPSIDATGTAPGETSPSTPIGEATPRTATDGASPAAAPFILQVRVAQSQASWVRVQVDGLVAYEGTLSGGQSKEWTVTQAATIRVGKPDAVMITRDGKQVTLPRTQGIGEMTISAQPE